jgi:hypothetical protein
MMRCEHCGGYAIFGLAHLHGNPNRPLCYTCTKLVLERQKQERQAKEIAEAKELMQRLCKSCTNPDSQAA